MAVKSLSTDTKRYIHFLFIFYLFFIYFFFLKKIFHKNGYPEPIVSRVMQQALDRQPALATESKKQEKVFIRLPWLGPTSAAFGNRIRRVTHAAIPICKPVCVFTTRRMLTTCVKDRLPTESWSNVVYLFNCACGHSYVGRTMQRLEERIKQHVPKSLFTGAGCQENEESGTLKNKKEKGKEKNSSKKGATTGANEEEEQAQGVDTAQVRWRRQRRRGRRRRRWQRGVSTSASARVLRPRSGQLKKTIKTGDVPEKTLPRATSTSDSGISTRISARVLRSQSRQLKKTKTADVCEKTLPPAISKSDSGITRHLKTSAECRNAVCSNPVKRFRVLAKARNSGHLSFLEAVFISRLSPVLYVHRKNLYVV